MGIARQRWKCWFWMRRSMTVKGRGMMMGGEGGADKFGKSSGWYYILLDFDVSDSIIGVLGTLASNGVSERYMMPATGYPLVPTLAWALARWANGISSHEKAASRHQASIEQAGTSKPAHRARLRDRGLGLTSPHRASTPALVRLLACTFSPFHLSTTAIPPTISR